MPKVSWKKSRVCLQRSFIIQCRRSFFPFSFVDCNDSRLKYEHNECWLTLSRTNNIRFDIVAECWCVRGNVEQAKTSCHSFMSIYIHECTSNVCFFFSLIGFSFFFNTARKRWIHFFPDPQIGLQKPTLFPIFAAYAKKVKGSKRMFVSSFVCESAAYLHWREIYEHNFALADAERASLSLSLYVVDRRAPFQNITAEKMAPIFHCWAPMFESIHDEIVRFIFRKCQKKKGKKPWQLMVLKFDFIWRIIYLCEFHSTDVTLKIK